MESTSKLYLSNKNIRQFGDAHETVACCNIAIATVEMTIWTNLILLVLNISKV